MMTENAETNMTAVPEMKLELVPVPVSDVDRARAFYEKAGFHLEVDTQPTDTMRVVQFTPPGSACSIVFGTGMGELTAMPPGSVKGLHLVVADIGVARSALVERGLEVGEITDMQGVKYAGFSDPDGNLWLLQEFPPELRQPGQSFSQSQGKP
jgi:predicted enzyme related to lactoylglutathione lyase